MEETTGVVTRTMGDPEYKPPVLNEKIPWQ